MNMFEGRLELGSNSVLLATDLLPSSETATAYAVRFARRYNAKITAVQVFDYAWAGSPKTGGLPSGLAAMHSAAEDALEDLRVDLCKENVRCEVTLIDGNPASEILDAITTRNIDLAILGTHAREGWERLAWGSVAEQVLRKASCPVLTIGPRVPAPSKRELPFRNLVYATDFSVQSIKALPYAVALSNDCDACLNLLHVLPPSTKESSDQQSITDRFKEFTKDLSSSETKIVGNSQYEVRYGDDVARTVLKQADADSSDLIVLGVNRASHLASHLPDITSNIIAEAKCPVLTVSS
jgi:nucleotide-binding universal stress UspA family protein